MGERRGYSGIAGQTKQIVGVNRVSELKIVSSGKNTVELRGDSPEEVVSVIDAISLARRMNRMQLVNEILSEWVRQKLHETTLVQRVMRSNPAQAEATPGASE